MTFETDSPEYFLSMYGHCSLADRYFAGERRTNDCTCVRPGEPWLGVACPNWTPLGPTTHEEMLDANRRS